LAKLRVNFTSATRVTSGGKKEKCEERRERGGDWGKEE